ncbi:MAG: OmpA family protein [Gammaproteobacteria bacterium]|nr:OmpA family protein [Gammaproteobacteria bacterium]
MKKAFTFIFLLFLFVSGVSFFTVWDNLSREVAQQSASQMEQMVQKTEAAVHDADNSPDPMRVGASEGTFETTENQTVAETRTAIKETGQTVDSASDKSNSVAQDKEVISFPSGGFALGQQQKSALSALAEVLQDNTNKIANIVGYSDSIGSAQVNDKVSLARAVSVEQFFRGQGIPGEQLNIQNHGSASPVASNLTAAGRQENRRVEVILE